MNVSFFLFTLYDLPCIGPTLVSSQFLSGHFLNKSATVHLITISSCDSLFFSPTDEDSPPSDGRIRFKKPTKRSSGEQTSDLNVSSKKKKKKSKDSDEKKKNSGKKVKNSSLLSFGDDEEET